MKKILFLLSMALFTLISVQAQRVPTAVTRSISSFDTLTNVDTSAINYNSIGSHVKGFQATVTKVSGTVAGKVYLQGTIDGYAWVTIDSLTLSNQATNTKIFPITATTYNSYRSNAITSGTQVSVLTLAVLRRQDE